MDRKQIAKLFTVAAAKGYAIPHFNHSDFWDMAAIVEAGQKARAPIFVASLPKVVDAIGMEELCAVMDVIRQRSETPIIYHLDHCHEVDMCLRAIDNGYNSVMIDASHGTLEENIQAVSRVVEYGHKRNVFVEAEIGQIKGAGDEGKDNIDKKATVEEAEILVKETGVDALAVAIGNEHGFYTSKPQLDFKLLQQIKEAVTIPLVLHGGTGIPAADIKRAISKGIGKVNIGTHIRHTYINSVGEAIDQMGPQTHTADIMAVAKAKTSHVVDQWIKTCAADGKA